MSDPVAAAQAHQAQIDALWDFDDPAASEARFRSAADAAQGTERDILLTQVARALGLDSRYADSLAVLDGLPTASNGSELQVRVELERGRVLNSSGDPAAARPLFESAFLAASDVGFEHLAVDALHMVAIVAPAAEQDELNQRALDLARSAADPRARRWRASLLNNMGWTAFDRGDLDDALGLFEEAVEARIEQQQPQEEMIARWCVARTLREMGRTQEALDIQLALVDAHRAAGTSDPEVDEEIELCRAALAGR